ECIDEINTCFIYVQQNRKRQPVKGWRLLCELTDQI
ncbi:hypothetical protein VINI7043_13511, partial [Vibrio nigripulchritudo ATCC 27043]